MPTPPFLPRHSDFHHGHGAQSDGLYGDTAQRNYGNKLALFNQFAAPELRQVIAWLGLQPRQVVLDAGCGAGHITQWLHEAVTPGGYAIGLELAAAHCTMARAITTHVVQANVSQLPFVPETFDWIWTSNTLNHLAQPSAELRQLAAWLKPEGRLAIGQSSFLPEMIFAWDARLEREATYACRRYYCNKYGLGERDLSAPRHWVGVLRAVGFTDVTAKTVVIERVAPLSLFDEFYFAEWFKNYWGHRVQAHVQHQDWQEIAWLTDPNSPYFAPRRPDFHYIETFTVVVGGKPRADASAVREAAMDTDKGPRPWVSVERSSQ